MWRGPGQPGPGAPIYVGDFIYCVLVLQHIHPTAARAQIVALIRLLRPGGVFVFQAPAAPAESHPSPVPMADEAYSADLALILPPPERVMPAAEFHLGVRITNTSPATWEAGHVGSIRAGNHWLDAHGWMIVQDDGRSDLPGPLAPGASREVVLAILAPEEPGRFTLELDIVHEGITWFSDRGSPSLRVPVHVIASTPEDQTPEGDPVPEGLAEGDVAMPDYGTIDLSECLAPEPEHVPIGPFPMHGIPQGDVLAIVAGAGAEVLAVTEDDHAKPESTGYRYVVRWPGG